MDQITFDGSYDLSAPVLFFPIRHHSPVCTFHLRRVLEAYRPNAVLVEGPWDTNHLIEHIADPESKPPFCIYYTCVHKEDTGKESRRACYFPLMEYSPEWVAIRAGVEQGLLTQFIDLPYSVLSRMETRTHEEEGKETYYDDAHMARSAYIQRLCEKQGCRHYSELWEKLFEIGGLTLSTDTFVRNMRAFCHYSRVEYPVELLGEEGCIAREAYMAENIARVSETHQRVLVVTGGFHTEALAERLSKPIAPQKHVFPKGDSYLIPYSMAECDQLSGYASGMPYPAYFQMVSQNLAEPSAAYRAATLRSLAVIGGALRRDKQAVSMADEAAAFHQTLGLAALRDKHQPGVYELLDGVLSAYVKGEYNAQSSLVMQTAWETLRGDAMGTVTPAAGQIPLLLDFAAQCTRFRLKPGTLSKQETVLELLSKPAHREASAFFHRLDFLEVGFGTLRFGPDYSSLDTSRVREKWSYTVSARVQSRLVDVSRLGGTVQEAARTKLIDLRDKQTAAGEATRLLIKAAVMALTDQLNLLLARLEAVIAADSSFLSLSAAAANLLFLENAKALLRLPELPYAGRLLQQVYHKALAELPLLDTQQPEEDLAFAKALKSLHQLAKADSLEAALFYDALSELCARKNPPAALHGAASGFLYSGGLIDPEQTFAHANAYLRGTREMMRRSGQFFTGLLMSAWDLLFSHGAFVKGLSDLLHALSHEDFLVVLPDLRLAFSVLSPAQTHRLGKMIAGLTGLAPDFLRQKAVSEEMLLLGRLLDAYARKKTEVTRVG